MGILIQKADGSLEPFSIEKVIRTCLRAGLDETASAAIAQRIRGRLYSRDTALRIVQLLHAELSSVHPKHGMLLKLREAISQISPLRFEEYVKKVLEANGYSCIWNRIVRGAVVEHQIDVIAEKNGRQYLVEVKHHTNFHRECGLGIALQNYARILDVNDGSRLKKNRYHFDAAWLVTNTKFSDHAKRYSSAKNIQLTGWGWKGQESLASLVERTRTFPITLLPIEPHFIALLEDANILTFKDIEEQVQKIQSMIPEGTARVILESVRHFQLDDS